MKPQIMGVLNVTPDSFSDGGLYTDVEAAVEHALRMKEEGASVIDIGAESTRPGFTPVPEQEEIRRLVPVIRRIRECSDVRISVDTMKAGTMRAALEAGADIINDVNGLRGEGMMELAASSGAEVVIMHMRGEPENTHAEDMQGDVLAQIKAFLDEQTERAVDMGVRRSDIILDPGVGFGKTMEDNERIIDSSSYFSDDLRILVGASRKRVLKTMYPGTDRDVATVKASLRAIASGASIVRVHNVALMQEALTRSGN